jgi:hypothetical protein
MMLLRQVADGGGSWIAPGQTKQRAFDTLLDLFRRNLKVGDPLRPLASSPSAERRAVGLAQAAAGKYPALIDRRRNRR